MLPKGHARTWAIMLQLALAIGFLAVLALHAPAAGIAPIGGAVNTYQHPSLGLVQRRIIGDKLPPLPGLVDTRQGSGPAPDSNLTPNAIATPEVQPDSSPTDTMNRVAFASTGVDDDEDGLIDDALPTTPGFEENYNIWIMRPDGSEQVRITDLAGDEIEPAYDPGARLIAFAGNQTGQWEIYTVEIASGVIRCLTDKQPDPRGNKTHPTWSPDGNWIAYQCDAEGSWDIYKLPSTGAAQQQRLTIAPGDETQPAWQPAGNALSPAGNAIAYTAQTGAVTRIQWVNAVTLEVDVLTEGGGDPLASDADPAWSRDATMMAFASDRFTDADVARDYNVFRMGALGEIGIDSVLVSNADPADTADDRCPTWSPRLFRQPMRIFYESQRDDGDGGEPDIWHTFFDDARPPYMTDLPTIDDRRPEPGNDAVIHVPVFDDDSGVQSVYAVIKDPNDKIWVYESHGVMNTSVSGIQALEWDYQVVATVQLWDLGDPADYDDVEGDGIFSGYWETPLAPTQDWVIDIRVTDLVGNTQTYDDVGGFTTRVFQPTSNVLLVNDYCEGQYFLYQLGYNNDYPAAWHCESFYTYNPGFGDSGVPDYDSISDYAATQGITESYDLWRIICRGPVPESVYQYYLPTLEYQLEPQEAVDDPEDAAPTREVRVAERAVIWACPHAGSVWNGNSSGTITDAMTQADVAFFLDRGGRLFISGADIAWALTLNGTVTNSFLQNDLHAQFVSDGYRLATTVTNPGPGYSTLQHTDYGFQCSGRSGDPVSQDAWANSGDSHWGTAWQPMELHTPRDLIVTTEPTYGDAHEWSIYPDSISALSGATKIYGYGGDFDEGPTAALRSEDAITSSRLVYLAFGFESIHREYNSTDGCYNRRSHLMHNILCWMRTGAIQGRVLSITDGMTPINDPNPLVKLWIGNEGAPSVGETPDFVVRCQDDGTFVVSGLPPAGRYTLEATREGFEIDRFEAWRVHGGWPPYTIDLAISRWKPGGVAGTVTSEATDDPLALVTVSVYAVPEEEGDTASVDTAQGAGQEPDWDELGDPLATDTTGANGAYNIGELEPGDYYVLADGSAINYGNAWAQITVTSGNLTSEDFQLPAADGTLVATVNDVDGGAAILNALVEVKTTAGVTVGSGVTDNTGTVRIDMQPGTFEALAAAAGYEDAPEQSVTIVSSEEDTAAFLLQAEPPGSISGQVVTASSGAPVAGVRVDILVNDIIINTTTTSADLVDPGDGGPDYNYRFDNVPTGSITVRPTPTGFTATPAEQVVTVNSGLTTSSVNFVLTGLHTFPAGLQLVSTPYDYSANDPATLLSVDPDDLLLASWEASRQRYRLYPQAPGDHFRLGSGYWLRLPVTTDITLQGLDAVDPMPIPVESGWNLIGAPYPVLIDFFATLVEDRNGIIYTVQEALSEGLIEGGMFAYVLGGYQNTSVFNPWVGTWLKAGESLTLHVSKSAGALAAPSAGRPAVAAPEDGWLVTLEASVGGMLDASTHFGAAASATAGYDAGADMAKPPAADFAPCIYAAFDNADWGARKGNYSVDVRSAGDAGATWRLKVWTNQEGEDVTLRWPNLGTAPADAKPVLRDLVADKNIYMRTSASYTFSAGAEPRAFEIALGGAAGEALTLTGVHAQQAPGGRSQIAYTLSKSANVNVELLNIAGRLVRRICADKAQSRGANSVLWDGRADGGLPVPNGRYLVKVTARADDGQETQVVAPLSVRR